LLSRSRWLVLWRSIRTSSALPAELGFGRSFRAYVSRSHQGQFMELRFIPMRIGNTANSLGLVVMDQFTRRIIGFGVHRGILDGVALCRMFHRAIRGHSLPKYPSSDHDPLYRYHQCEANLRILEVTEIQTVPYVPLSHPSESDLSARFAASISTASYSGPQPIWRRSCESFRNISMSTGRTRG
jgi:hypothetical protein